jgi:hypothetical protein
MGMLEPYADVLAPRAEILDALRRILPPESIVAEPIAIGMGEFNRIREIDCPNRCIVAEPGVKAQWQRLKDRIGVTAI